MHPLFPLACLAASFVVGWYVARVSYLRGYRDGAIDARRRERATTWPEPAAETRAN